MTLIVAFLAVDNKHPAPQPSSIYIVSDSRISWSSSTTKEHFDCGRKIFGCMNSPDIFGYCGNALFPSLILSQISDLADQGLLFERHWSCEEKFQCIKNKLINIFEQFPFDHTVEIIHASRDEHGEFFCGGLELSHNREPQITVPEFKNHSDKLFVLGSGSENFLEKFTLYADQKTSRSVFHCFTDTLSEGKDKCIGGAPQLVGLYRKDYAKFFGIIYNERRYLHGLPIDNMSNFDRVEWRNELFERCNGNTMKRIEDAQKQPNPLLQR
jgi:hypothetical protein